MDDAAAVDALLADLARWSSEQQVDEAVRARTRERWMRQRAGEEASFSGLLLDLAEQAIPVVLRTTTGRSHRGPIVAVGQDFLALSAPGSRAVFVSTGAIASIRPEPGTRVGDAPSGRSGAVPSRLVDVLLGLSADRPRVQIHAGGEPVAGELRSVGIDVVSVLLDTRPPASVYLRLDSVAEVSLLVSG